MRSSSNINEVVNRIFGGTILKNSQRLAALLVIVGTVLVGCSGVGSLVPSGAGSNSEVPSTIGKYTLVTDQNEAELRCQERIARDGVPIADAYYQPTENHSYSGVFTYVHDVYKEAANNGPNRDCDAVGRESDAPAGMAVVFVNKGVEAREEKCTYDDYAITCVWNIDDLRVGVRATTTGENPPEKKDLKKIAESFTKSAKLKI